MSEREREPDESYSGGESEWLCPLCGGPNDCGMANSVAQCWCFAVDVRPEVLAQVPLAAAGKSCLCRACAGGAHQRRGVLTQIQELLKRRRG